MLLYVVRICFSFLSFFLFFLSVFIHFIFLIPEGSAARKRVKDKRAINEDYDIPMTVAMSKLNQSRRLLLKLSGQLMPKAGISWFV